MTYERRAVKQRALRNLKRHYLLLVVLCAVSIFLGTEFTGLVRNAQSWYDTLSGRVTQLAGEGIHEAKTGRSKVIDDLIADNLEAGRQEAAERMRALQYETDPNSALGRSRGIFAALANNISSGNLYAVLGSAIHSVIHSQQVVAGIMVLFSVALYALVWVFVRNMYRAILRRAFMETRVYDEFPLGHLLHFKLVRRWNNTALTLLLQEAYEVLWSLTLVGGVIKRYAYFLTPFIVAENPDIRPNEAITLSRRMMNGHKWECCKLELSFLLWHIPGFLTFGAVDALFAVPYEMSAYTEYYAMLRAEAKEKGLEGAERLNDDFLFAPAPEAALGKAYANVARVEGVLDEDIILLSPVKRFFVKNFGIWMGSLVEKQVFSRQEGLRQQTRVARMEMTGDA